MHAAHTMLRLHVSPSSRLSGAPPFVRGVSIRRVSGEGRKGVVGAHQSQVRARTSTGVEAEAWSPPSSRHRSDENSVELVRKLAPEYIEGEDYRVLALSGNHHVQNLNPFLRRLAKPFVQELPIFTNAPGAIVFDAEEELTGAPERHDVPGLEGVFVLTNVLTRDECIRMAAMSEAMGYERPPLSVGQNVRDNSNVEWTVDETVMGPIFQRCKDLLPQAVEGKALCGINVRWRLYRYEQSEIFRPHIDAPWPGSGIDDDGNFVFDYYGDQKSQITFLMYLNDDFEGGYTSFFKPKKEGESEHEKICSVKVPQGGVLCFFHGDHPLSMWHEGSLLTKGTKYVVRSEVLYKL